MLKYDASVFVLPCKHDHYCHISKDPCHSDNDQEDPFEGELQVLLVVLLLICCHIDLRTGVLTDTQMGKRYPKKDNPKVETFHVICNEKLRENIAQPNSSRSKSQVKV